MEGGWYQLRLIRKENVPMYHCVSRGKTTPVHTDVADSVGVCVFMDDVTFSGLQAAKNTGFMVNQRMLIYGSVSAT